MALKCMDIQTDNWLSQQAQTQLRKSLEAGFTPVLFAASFSEQIQLAQFLSRNGLDFGCKVTTFKTWLEGVWRMFGDGRQLVSADERYIHMRQVVQERTQSDDPDKLSFSEGLVRLCVRLAAEDLPYVPKVAETILSNLAQAEGDKGKAPYVATRLSALLKTKPRLSAMDLRVYDCLQAYADRIQEKGLVEPSQAALVISSFMAGAGVRPEPLFVHVSGYLPSWQQDAYLALSCSADCTCLFRMSHVAQTQLAGLTYRQMVEKAQAAGIPCECLAADPADQKIAEPWELAEKVTPELLKLSSGLFDSQTLADQVPATACSMLLSAGDLAKNQLIVDAVKERIQAGADSICIASPVMSGFASDLKDKLIAQGISVDLDYGIPLMELSSGRVLLKFLPFMAKLIEQAEDEGDSVPGYDPETGRVNPGQMRWWAPRTIIDFLLSDFSGVDQKTCWDLDRNWRARRKLAASQVVDVLTRQSRTSHAVSQMVIELKKGRVAHGLEALKGQILREIQDLDNAGFKETVFQASQDQDQAVIDATCQLAADLASQRRLSLEQALLVVETLQSAAHALTAAGVRCSQAKDGRTVSLSQFMDQLVQLAQLHPAWMRFSLQADCPLEGASQVKVLLCDQQAASRLAPASQDVVILCDMDTVHAPIPVSDSLDTLLMESLSGTKRAEPMALAREKFGKMVAVAKDHLICQRSLVDASGKELYPSVILSELLAVYGYAGDKDQPFPLPISSRGEERVAENTTYRGRPLEEISAMTLGATGTLSQENKPLIIVPREGVEQTEDLMPTLSASQIESYLACPYKWFIERRLGLTDSDANFSNLEMGTFAHKVLEETRKRLFCQAAGISMDEFEAYMPAEHSLVGSRITEDNLVDAVDILNQVFSDELAKQYDNKATKRSQALIAHTQAEIFQLDAMNKNLASLLEFEKDVFLGFEPRMFELRFGGRDGKSVTYAGVHFTGSIDRVDVDAQGNALIIDYKNKNLTVTGEYALSDPQGASDQFQLPRHVQSLIYAQVLRKAMPDLNVVGAVYLGTRDRHEISGAVKESVAERVWGTEKVSWHCCWNGSESFEFMLDSCEALITQAIERLRAGDIQACPRNKDACQWCPLTVCERRLS